MHTYIQLHIASIQAQHFQNVFLLINASKIFIEECFKVICDNATLRLSLQV